MKSKAMARSGYRAMWNSYIGDYWCYGFNAMYKWWRKQGRN